MKIKSFILVFLCCIAYVNAYARHFEVRSGADFGDIVPGDGICADMNGDCTFRAALEESNASVGSDTIMVYQNLAFVGTQFLVTDSFLYINYNDFAIDAGNFSSSIFMYISAKHVTFDRLDIRSVPGVGLYLNGAHNFTMRNSSITGRGIDTGSALVESINSNNCLISGCFLSRGGLGVRLTRSHYGVIENCISIYNNHSNMTAFDSHDCVFWDNYIGYSKDFDAYFIYGVHHCSFMRNTVIGASLGGLTLGLASQTNFLKTRENTISGNIFIQNGSGIQIGSNVENIFIKDNIFLNNEYGITSSNISHNLHIKGNTFKDAGSDAITLDSAVGTVIDSNIIGGSGGHGINLKLCQNSIIAWNKSKALSE